MKKPVRPLHRSTCQSIPIHLQRQLLNDILNSGGLFATSLRCICDSNPHLYGFPGTKERKRIQNKVYRWKLLSEEEFADLIFWLNTTDFFVDDPEKPPNNRQSSQQASTDPSMPGEKTPPPNSNGRSATSWTIPPPYGSNDFSDCSEYCHVASCLLIVDCFICSLIWLPFPSFSAHPCRERPPRIIQPLPSYPFHGSRS